MARRVIGLDVGTFSVKVVHLEARARALEYDVVAYVEAPLSKFIKEGVESAESDLQVEAVLDLKQRGYLDSSWITTGMPSPDAQIRSLEVPFDNPKKIEAVLGGLLDAHLPFPVENLHYSWFAAEKGASQRILVGFTKREAVSQYLAALRKAEVDPRVLTLKAAALYDLLAEVAAKDADENALFAIADIGHKSTGICVGSKKAMRFARSVPRGGFQVTHALAQKKDISFDEAEKLKIEASELNEDLREAYYSIARELRQTILAMETEAQRKVEHVFLIGGGAKTKGLEEFLSTLLSAPVSVLNRFAHFRYMPPVDSKLRSERAPTAEGGLALSYAALGENVSNKEPRFNFRKDEFSFSGELNYMRQRGKTLIAWSAVTVLLLGLWAAVNNWVLSANISDLKNKQKEICSSILGQKINSASECLSLMQETIGEQGNLGVPEWSAADIYLELAKAIPSDIKIKITDLDINGVKVQFSAETSSFEAVEQVVASLVQSHCLSKNEKSRTRQTQTGIIQFQVNSEFNCGKIREAPALKLLESPKEK